MDSDRANSSLGPVIFFGLAGYVFLAQAFVPVPFANPADSMDVAAISRAESVPLVPARFSAREPATPPVLAPQRHAVVQPDRSSLDPVLVVRSPPPQSPLRFYADAADRMRGALVTSQTSTLPAPALPRFSDQTRPGEFPTAMAVPRIATPPERPLHEWVRVTGIAVNLRSAPEVSADQIAQFDNGALALRVEISGSWSRIFFLTQELRQSGWMASRFLQLDAP